MNKAIIIQGRETTPKDIALVREMIKANPSWGRSRLSKELALFWNWRALSGQLEDMACRTFLLKLERRGYISLPAPSALLPKSQQESFLSLCSSSDWGDCRQA